MSICGATPKDRRFTSNCFPAQHRAVDAVSPLSAFSSHLAWQDDHIGIVGRGDASASVHDDVALFVSGRITNTREIALKLGEPERTGLFNILQAYCRWGTDFPRYLVGDFALALWDCRERRLLLARDAAGYRPLHYCVRGEQFRFASEAKDLFAQGDIPVVADERKIAHWLSRIPDVPGTTFFRGISSVPPGHTVVWSHGHIIARDFWKPENTPELRLADPREYAEGLASTLEEAVRDRLGSFKNAGCHLSGGLDSSSVTALASNIVSERGGRVSAFTAVPTVAVEDARFPGRFCNESAHAAATAARYPNIQHILIPTVSGSLLESLDRISSAAECPQLNPGNSSWSVSICAEAARRGLPVMLTGAGGNFTVSYDGRRALSTLLAAGRFIRLCVSRSHNIRTELPGVRSAGLLLARYSLPALAVPSNRFVASAP